ncbi:50S ribosomal protein L31 [bacterium]|jgi:large subunit ribosomal protein L31|nr:50S ribosomal protein L31 [bacterium]
MKKDIHPKSYLAKFSCACGAEFEALSTSELVKLEICSACHPYYTGKQKFVDIAGRVDRFKKRYAGVSKP